MTNLQRIAAVRLAAMIIAAFVVYQVGSIMGYSDGYEAGLRHGMEMSK